MEKLTPYIDVVGRVFLALIFVISGFGKITGYAGAQGYMESVGVPGALLPLVILVELAGGIALIVGWQTRIVAFLLAGFCLVSALIFHFQPADQFQMIMFMKNIAIAGGLLVLVSVGAGSVSIDRRLTKA